MVGILALLAIIIRFVVAYKTSYWVDEIVMIAVGRGSTQSVLDFIIQDTAHGPFSWLLIHGLTRIGEAEWFLRLPSVLASGLSVYYAYFFMRDTMGRRAGLIAAVLFTISLNGINYGTDARYYAFLVFFAMAMVFHYQAALRTGLKRHYILFGIATLASIYNAHFAFFLGLVLGIDFLGSLIFNLVKRDKKPWFSRYFKVALAGLIALILYLPWLPVLLSFFGGPWGITGGSYISEATAGTSMEKLLQLIAGRFGIGSFANPEKDLISLLFPALFLLMWVQGKRELANRILLLLWLIIPIYILLTVQARHYFTVRYFMISFPPLVLGAAGGLDRIWSGIVWLLKKVRPFLLAKDRIPLLKLAPLGSLVMLVALSAPYLHDLYRYPKQDWKAAVSYINTNAHPGDVLFMSSGDMIGTCYYLNPDDSGLLVESRDDALQWICSGDHDVWMITHYFENHSAIFQEWARSNLELVKMLPGTMIPIYIYRYHRPDLVARGTHFCWFPSLNPPEGINAPLDLNQQQILAPVTIPESKSVTLNNLGKLYGTLVTTLHSASPIDNGTCSLTVFGEDSKPTHQQISFCNNQTSSVIWQPEKNSHLAIQLLSGSKGCSYRVCDTSQAQQLGPVSGFCLPAQNIWRKKFELTQDGVWQFLIDVNSKGGKSLSLSIDGLAIPLKNVETNILQSETRLSWGTHIMELGAQDNVHIKWITVNLDAFPDPAIPDFNAKFKKRIEHISTGDYLFSVNAMVPKESKLSFLGWIDVYDPLRYITLSRFLIVNLPSGVMETFKYPPSFTEDFPIAGIINMAHTSEQGNQAYFAVRVLEGPLEISYHEVFPESLTISKINIIPFASDNATKEILDKTAIGFQKDSSAFHNNVGAPQQDQGGLELRVDGNNKADYLAWGCYLDLGEGIYQLTADIPESHNNFVLDLYTDITGSIAKRFDSKQLIALVNRYLTLENRVFWQGQGVLRFGGIKLVELAGPLDAGKIKKYLLNNYKDSQTPVSIKDIKELLWDKTQQVYP